MRSPTRLLLQVLAWPVESQRRSRRNALVASTALAQRRRERDEVEAFLGACTGTAGADVAPGGTHAARRDVI